MTYLLLKYVHVLSSVVLVGTGFGTAYYLYFANRSANVAAQAEVARLVVRADAWFTTPAIIIQPLTGLLMAHRAGFAWTTPWILWALVLYVFTVACWLPVVWLQIRMARMARDSARSGSPLPVRYAHHARCWEALGYPAFIAMLAIFWLMVAKPA